MTIFITVLSITLISGFLALLIVIADKYINNYGICTITVNEEKKLSVDGGSTLLSSLADEKIFIPSACGGKATCGYCKVKAIDGATALLPTETPYLNEQEKKDGIRLSCQIKVKKDMKIMIPDELFRIKKFKTTVSKINEMTHDINEYKLKLIEPSVIDFKAGQYVQVASKPYKKVRESVQRAYSISSSPEKTDSVELIIRLVPGGICTEFMHNHIREGEEIEISGPYGDFYIRESDDDIIFIAGGSGLAPIKSMVEDLLSKGTARKMTFFFGAVSKKDLYYVDYFNELEKNINFKYVPALSNPIADDLWKGEIGLITKVVDRYIDDGMGKQAYLCGSPGMINACVSLLVEKGFRDESIFFDKF